MVTDQDGVLVHKPEKCDDGYRLYSGRMTEQAHLMDMDGEIVHTWEYEQGLTWHYAEMLSSGHLLAVIKEQKGQVDGMVVELDWEGELVGKVDVPAHHDIERLDNGNTLVLCREYVENGKIRQGTIKSDAILELTPFGEVAWEWHIDQHVDDIGAFVDVNLPAEQSDWAHTNTVESLPENQTGLKDERFQAGNILTSPRNLDTICVVEKGTGEVLWAWGPGVLDRQHMPTMLENGNILVFDNGTNRGYSRVVEVDPLEKKIVWEYRADPPDSFYTPTRGSNERLPNGNTFITDSDNGRLFEVTPDREIVWEFLHPTVLDSGRRMPMYRALRYPRDLVDTLRLS